MKLFLWSVLVLLFKRRFSLLVDKILKISSSPDFFTMLLKSNLSLLSRLASRCSNANAVRFLSGNNHQHFDVKYEIVEPIYPISFPVRTFPPTIGKPNYARNGCPNKHANSSYVKKVEDIAKIWNACKIAKRILMTTGRQVKVWLIVFFFFSLY